MQSETPVSPSDPSPVTSLKSLAPTTAAAAPSPPPPPSTPVEEESLSPKAAPSDESMDSQPLEVDEEWEDPSARKTRKGKTTKAAKNVSCCSSHLSIFCLILSFLISFRRRQVCF